MLFVHANSAEQLFRLRQGWLQGDASANSALSATGSSMPPAEPKPYRSSSVGIMKFLYGKRKHVPNHQPVLIRTSIILCITKRWKKSSTPAMTYLDLLKEASHCHLPCRFLFSSFPIVKMLKNHRQTANPTQSKKSWLYIPLYPHWWLLVEH